MADIAATARAITYVDSGKTVFGNKKVRIGTMTLVCNGSSDTVPTAGVNFTPANVGLQGVDIVLFAVGTVAWKYSSSMAIAIGTGASSGVKFAVGGGAQIPAQNEAFQFIAIGYGSA